MGEPITGAWLRNNQIAYADATKWGTGVNPIHQFYGGPALRTYGRNNQPPDITPPSEAPAGFVETGPPWGYDPSDLAGLDVFASDYQAVNGVYYDNDDRPYWGQSITETRATIPADSARPWGSSGGFKNILRSVITGPGNVNMLGHGFSYNIPTETVSEGWLNKPSTGKLVAGELPDAETSDPSQYEMQTSMTQRYKTQNNERAVTRGTDDDREPIDSRVAPMKLKVYSGEQRHIDMFPYQIDQIPRPFHYRTAGTGRSAEMAPNEMFVITTLQRTPPPDPSMGPEDTSLTEADGGYTAEDQGWY
jgi:hypothetical protein